ncbi:hypothetical protein TREVI0001_0212 [Treponema vincentii ATCC 35580]|uniref:Uncharacterized protein n=1 Tax=Treponema vincentii ATCC 35580 TaxID=596324 RepID=C8PTW9_9SPIR|nr:hypothetical protein TREVI0001_0212 [Treponema vincentii ATCC 35580]
MFNSCAKSAHVNKQVSERNLTVKVSGAILDAHLIPSFD